MKKLLIIPLLGLIVGFGNKPSSQVDDFDIPYRSIEHNAFQAGEKTSYLVHYGMIDAGVAELEIRNTDKKMKGRDMLHIVGFGESRGMVDFFFHVEDRYETYLDEEGVFPWLFIRDVSEGGYEIQQTYKFYQNRKQVETQKGKTHDVPAAVQDMLSSAFYVANERFKKSEKR